MSNKLISGFTFIKNGLTLGYCIKESIKSISPICDEIIINVGFDDPNCEKDDGTYAYLRDNFTHKKYIFLKSYWDPNITQDGKILAMQTDIALSKCQGEYCQYIQGDETIHENDLTIINNEVIKMSKNKKINGLVFKYYHLFGNVDTMRFTRKVYRREIRLIRNNLGIKSWKDAQGFRHKDNTKIICKLISARIFHYGWARKENIMEKKISVFDKLYFGNQYKNSSFNYKRLWGVKKFNQTHPCIMQEWINKNKNDIDILRLPIKFELDNFGLAICDFIENMTNYRLGEYKNYKLIK